MRQKLDRKITIESVKPQTINEKTKKISSKIPGGLKYAVVWTVYVFLGSFLFLYLEQTNEEVKLAHVSWKRFKEILYNKGAVEELYSVKDELSTLCPEAHNLLNTSLEFNISRPSISNILKNLSSEEDDLLILPTLDNILRENLWNKTQKLIEDVEEICSSFFFTTEMTKKVSEWSMYDAIYYTMTLVTTIGFGNISPSTPSGRLFSVFFALFGVPLTCLLLAKNSHYLSNRMARVYEYFKDNTKLPEKKTLWLVTWLFILNGCFIFMVLPAVVFSYIENWSFIDSIYFSFITLSTIGFGDLIAGYNMEKEVLHPNLYKISIVIWIMIALGYWVMLLNFLQKTIKRNAAKVKKTFKKRGLYRHANLVKEIIGRKNSINHFDDTEAMQEFTALVEQLSKDSVHHNWKQGEHAAPQYGYKRVDKSEEEYESEEEIKNDDVMNTIHKLPFCLEDFLNIEVCMDRQSLVDIAPTDVVKTEDKISNNNESGLSFKIKDIVQISLLASSLEADGSFDSESKSDYYDTYTNRVDPKESIPLLKDIFRLEECIIEKNDDGASGSNINNDTIITIADD